MLMSIRVKMESRILEICSKFTIEREISLYFSQLRSLSPLKKVLIK